MSESFSHEDNCFITLTYNDFNIPKSPSANFTLVKKDFQDYIKRVRASIQYDKKDIKLKYYAVGEYGENTNRPHYHAVIFGLGLDHIKYLEDAWSYGFVKVGSLTYDSARYVAGYVQKKLYGKEARQYGDCQPPFSLMSKGIGKEFVRENSSRLSSGGSVNIGQGRRYRANPYSNRILELSHEEIRRNAEAKSQEKEERFKALYSEFEIAHEDGFIEKISQDDVIADAKRKGRYQYNLELDKKYEKRGNL